MQKFEVAGHHASFLPDGEWKMIWHDEFDGKELDETKWAKRTHMMGKKSPHWVEDAYELDGNSNLLLKLEKRGEQYCTTQLQTGYNFMDLPAEEYDNAAAENREEAQKAENYYNWPIGAIKEPKFMHKYGYYECRCRMPEKEGWWCAFWLQSPIIGSTLNPEFSGVEVDIMEQFKREKYVPHQMIQHNNHWNGYGSQHESTGDFQVRLKDTEDGYHTFAVDWAPDYYRYYVDGELTWEVKAPYPVSQTEQFVLLTTEAVGYRSSDWIQWEDLAEAVGDVFVVDYVRVFERVE
ncbi:MAG: glycoside hydrolase family 16 protein [Lachnospiraceae bacterium]|nr:glycoside hydrolase family 16 protein [Lachnospiraceae bacterium]